MYHAVLFGSPGPTGVLCALQQPNAAPAVSTEDDASGGGHDRKAHDLQHCQCFDADTDIDDDMERFITDPTTTTTTEPNFPGNLQKNSTQAAHREFARNIHRLVVQEGRGP